MPLQIFELHVRIGMSKVSWCGCSFVRTGHFFIEEEQKTKLKAFLAGGHVLALFRTGLGKSLIDQLAPPILKKMSVGMKATVCGLDKTLPLKKVFLSLSLILKFL